MRQPLSCEGVIKKGRVVLVKNGTFPDGMRVLVTPQPAEKGSVQAILSAMRATPAAKSEDVDELLRLVDEGKRRVRYRGPFRERKNR